MKVFNSFKDLFNAYGGGGLSSFFCSRVTDNGVTKSRKRVKNMLRMGGRSLDDSETYKRRGGVNDTHLSNIIAAMELVQDTDDFDENRVPILPDPEEGGFVGEKDFIDTVRGLLTDKAYQDKYNELAKQHNSGAQFKVPLYPFGSKVKIVPGNEYYSRLSDAAMYKEERRKNERGFDDRDLKHMSSVFGDSEE